MIDKTKLENPFPSYYEQFIHVSRYAKWLEEDQRRERWDETVDRYMGFIVNKVIDNYHIEIPFDLHKELWNAIYNLEVVPSMRSVMTAGPALERDNTAGYNPVLGSTRVVTKEFGNVPIENLNGKTASVLNKNGAWSLASFKGYGEQKLLKINLKRNSNTKFSVECTKNHRWILQNGVVVSADSLKVGDKIDFISAPKASEDADYILGVRHGIVFGDGTATKSCERVKGYNLRLCGKNAELLKYFDGFPVCYPPSASGDPIVMLYDSFASTHSLKTLPKDETDSYVLGFIRGWLAADGNVSKAGQVSLATSECNVSWLLDNAERAGFVVEKGYKYPDITNYGTRKTPLIRVNFSRSSMSKEDFLCSWKQSNFRELISYFTVSEILDEGNKGEVYCAEVPDTNTFTLEGGILTGNCAYLPIDDIKSFDETMYILLCG